MINHETLSQEERRSPKPLVLPRTLSTIQKNVSLAPKTWFKVGGDAAYFYEPENLQDLKLVLKTLARDLPYEILGAGSNLLIRDGGIQGLVIHLGKAFRGFSIVNSKYIDVGAGLLDKKAAMFAYEAGIGGLEFLYTIPGTLGGALAMNAGAHGQEIKDVLQYAIALSPDGRLCYLSVNDLNYSYRTCGLNGRWTFLSARLKGTPTPKEKIYQKMLTLSEQRRKTQPSGLTGGSAFRNPSASVKAWELIEAAGCRDLTFGGAELSRKHCNFLVNKKKATARELETLGEMVRKHVLKKTGFCLQWEIIRMGEWL